MKAKRSLKNLIAATCCQAVVMILGFIVPRLTLSNYGSETNGYMNLVSQIYSYINLVEAGLGTAIVQALYSPIANDDKTVISSIINTARKYYRTISMIYAGCVVAVAIIVPFVISSSLSKTEMILYFLLFGISNLINFMFTASMRPLLIAEGKNYVTSNITMIFHFVSQGTKILLLNLSLNIVILQLAYTTINILQILVYYLYFNKNYKWIDKSVPSDNSLIKQRKAFFLQQISALIFSCTDVILLSVFCDLKVSSVYAVYMLVFNSLSIVLSLFSTSTQFILGQTYNSQREQYLPLHRSYDCCIVTIAFILFSTAAIVTLPFISLYTSGIKDINYIDPLIPIMMSINGMLATCKTASLCLINFSFHAEQTMPRTFIEAGLNIGISLVLVSLFGIKGVLLGTGVALIYRMIDTMIYVNRKILDDRIVESAKLYLSNFVVFGVLLFTSHNLNIMPKTYISFFITALIVFIVNSMVFCIVNYLNYRKYLNLYIKKLLLKVRHS